MNFLKSQDTPQNDRNPLRSPVSIRPSDYLKTDPKPLKRRPAGRLLWTAAGMAILMLIPFDGLAEPPVKAVNQADAATAGSLRSDWSPPDFKSRRDERDQMVSMIRSYGLKDEDVLHAMASVPRHEFVPEKQKQRAYRDSPLPIGHGQTISQPFIVAEMTRLLHVTPTSKVLEIGTGSGYQAAVLTEFTPHVFSVEIIEPLFKAARERLQRLGYETVQLRHGDGYYGWPEKAPFDGIVVTAASGEIPPPLLKQLKPGGRMIIPVGPVFGVQSLMLVQKDQSGAVRTRSLMSVRFVPFTRTENTRR